MAKKQLLKKLTAKHYEVMLLRAEGKRFKDICALFNIAEVTLNGWVMDPLFKEAEEKIKQQIIINAQNKIQNATEKAADTLIEACNGETKNGINIKAAELILKYAGLEPIKKIDANVNNNITIIDNIPELTEDEESDEDEC